MSGASFENPKVAILAGTRAESLGTTAFHCGCRNASGTDTALATPRRVPMPISQKSRSILPARLIHSMRRDGLKRGVVTLCIGGRQGVALALEATA